MMNYLLTKIRTLTDIKLLRELSNQSKGTEEMLEWFLLCFERLTEQMRQKSGAERRKKSHGINFSVGWGMSFFTNILILSGYTICL